MGPVHWILFDVDGTLIDARGAGRRSLEDAFAEVFALDAAPSTRGRVRYDGGMDRDIQEQVGLLAGLTVEQVRARRPELEAAYLRRLREALADREASAVMPGVPGLIARLAAQPDVRLALVTGNIEAGARVKLEPHGLFAAFATGGYGSDAETRPEAAAVACRRLADLTGRAADRRRITIVGDSTRDIECARWHGFRMVAVATGVTPAAGLEAAGAGICLEDLSDHDLVVRHLGLNGDSGGP